MRTRHPQQPSRVGYRLVRGVLAACPALKLLYNGRQLEVPPSFDA